TGLGAPYWDEAARGTIVGLTRGSGAAHIVRATLEAIAYQTRDLVECFAADAGRAPAELRVDGGACRNDFLMQFQADILGIPIRRPAELEVTALGAAGLAGIASSVWGSAGEFAAATSADLRTFEPRLSTERREALHAGWLRAVERARDWAVD
ncbi:MAG: FGGY-family carbohydrate kinase, partial [Dehalococcoidia bacterium]|nr:FGGY-family carbohydrate kinase [Dehalococcoidia bacterium]